MVVVAFIFIVTLAFNGWAISPALVVVFNLH